MRKMAETCKQRKKEWFRPSGAVDTVDDLANPEKFAVGDVSQLKRLMLLIEEDVIGFKELRVSTKKTVAELESAMLRVAMRKEEIVRFSKASTDPEFAKMLKGRTLGPETVRSFAFLPKQICLSLLRRLPSSPTSVLQGLVDD